MSTIQDDQITAAIRYAADAYDANPDAHADALMTSFLAGAAVAFLAVNAGKISLRQCHRVGEAIGRLALEFRKIDAMEASER
jgi:hypothetical protein